MKRAAATLLGCLAAAHVVSAVAAAPPAWHAVARIPGIFDIAGPRPDGWLVVAGAGRLYLVDPAGAVTPFAQGPGGYADDRGAEAYVATSPGLHPGGSGCAFQAGDVYVLRLHAPLGVTRVDVHGQKSAFAAIPGVTSLNGITFDTAGQFGYRLLVTGAAAGKTVVAAIDCSGAVDIITRSAPVVEGGLAVAPSSFGSFGGMLIAPDELSGNIYAISAEGAATTVARSGLPRGGDIGVEGLGFVPVGWQGGVYYSDRSTPGNPHPGTDSLIELTADELTGVGVQAGDLLAVTEGGTAMIDVRCATECSVQAVVATPTKAHGEGHLIFTGVRPPAVATPSAVPSPTTAPPASPARPRAPLSPAAIVTAILALAVLGAGALAVLRSRRR